MSLQWESNTRYSSLWHNLQSLGGRGGWKEGGNLRLALRTYLGGVLPTYLDAEYGVLLKLANCVLVLGLDIRKS